MYWVLWTIFVVIIITEFIDVDVSWQRVLMSDVHSVGRAAIWMTDAPRCAG